MMKCDSEFQRMRKCKDCELYQRGFGCTADCYYIKKGFKEAWTIQQKKIDILEKKIAQLSYDKK